jgi:hypothetical protein
VLIDDDPIDKKLGVDHHRSSPPHDPEEAFLEFSNKDEDRLFHPHRKNVLPKKIKGSNSNPQMFCLPKSNVLARKLLVLVLTQILSNLKHEFKTLQSHKKYTI